MKALNDGTYTKKHWLFSIFSKIYEEPDFYKTNPYNYRVVRTETGFYFVDPEKGGGLTLIEEADVNAPLFAFKERISLVPNDIPNVKEKVDTTYGNVLVNYLLLVYPFHDKIPFIKGKISVPQVEKIIESKLASDVPAGAKEDPNFIYVREYLRYGQAIFYLSGLNPICVPSASPKTLTRDPRTAEIRARELEANKDRLHDPAVIARIDKVLEDVDRAWVDDWGRDFYIKDKAYNNSRKKMFSMVGYEKGFIDGQPSTLVTKSLSEGWDFNNLPALINSSREGSFNRGAMTMLGGVAVKEAIRAMQNSKIVLGDCGSTMGIPLVITQKNASNYIGFYHIAGGVKEITPDNVSTLVGKQILLRRPILCKTLYTDYCSVCMGKKNADNPTGLSAMVAGVGSRFMGVFMKKMHVSALALAEYDHLSSIS